VVSDKQSTVTPNQFLMLLRLVGWEINVQFQQKIGYIVGKGLGWRFSSIRLRMANDTVTSRPCWLFVQRWTKMEKDKEGSFKLLH